MTTSNQHRKHDPSPGRNAEPQGHPVSPQPGGIRPVANQQRIPPIYYSVQKAISEHRYADVLDEVLEMDRSCASLKEQLEIIDKQRLKWERLAMDRGFALESTQEQLEAQEQMLNDVRRALSLDDMSRNDHEAGLTSEETLGFIREAVSNPASEVVDLDAGRKVCVYCGGDAHPAECGEPDPAESHD